VHSLNLDSYSLNLDPHSLNLDPHSQVPQFTCFTSTKVQTLMPEELLDPQLDPHLAWEKSADKILKILQGKRKKMKRGARARVRKRGARV
jgi:hypothetical protein